MEIEVKYKVEIFMNETDSIILHDVLFISFIAELVKFDRKFDCPIFEMDEIFKVDIRVQND